MRIRNPRVGIAISLAISLASPPDRARADDGAAPPAAHPSPADIAAATERVQRGRRLLAQGDYAAAIAELELAYQLDPRPEHLYNLAVAHHRNADRDEAIDYYRRYLAAEPNGKLAGEAQRYLHELEAEAAVERADAAQATAKAARDAAEAAHADVTAARAEAEVARARADRAEQAARAPAAVPSAANRSGAPPAAAEADPVARPYDPTEDTGAQRGWIMPTAVTAPAGTWSLSSFELIAVSASYAVTDRLAISLGALLPVASDLAVDADIKLQLLRVGRLRIAAHGLLAYAWNSDAAGSQTLTHLGGVATLCLDDGCRSQVSGYLGAGVVQDGGASTLLVGAGSASFALGSHLTAVFELDSGAGYGPARGSLGWYGVQFPWRTFALDLGLARTLGASADRGGAANLPFLGLTFRSPG